MTLEWHVYLRYSRDYFPDGSGERDAPISRFTEILDYLRPRVVVFPSAVASGKLTVDGRPVLVTLKYKCGPFIRDVRFMRAPRGTGILYAYVSAFA